MFDRLLDMSRITLTASKVASIEERASQLSVQAACLLYALGLARRAHEAGSSPDGEVTERIRHEVEQVSLAASAFGPDMQQLLARSHIALVRTNFQEEG